MIFLVFLDFLGFLTTIISSSSSVSLLGGSYSSSCNSSSSCVNIDSLNGWGGSVGGPGWLATTAFDDKAGVIYRITYSGT